MPARSVQMEIYNATRHTLTRVDSKRCHGEWTQSWEPSQKAQTIGPGQRREWRAESGGDIPIVGSIGTGTEGWVKFRIDGVGDTVYFYWANPFVGNTFFDFKVSTGNIKAPCDDDSDAPNASSLFPPNPSQFEFFPIHIALDGTSLVGVTEGAIGDEEFGMILPFPGQNRLFEHAWFTIGLREKSSTSMMLVCQAINVDPRKGMRSLAPGLSSFSIRERLRV